MGLGRRVARVARRRPATRPGSTTSASTTSAGCAACTSTAATSCPRLLADPDLLGSFEEGRLFGADWLRSLGAIPNEYLHYYYFNREAVRAYQEAKQTRGAFLRDQQARFYEEMSGPDAAARWPPGTAPAPSARPPTWRENREAAGAGERDADDLESGGYEKVALALMRAIARDERATLILNVRNRRAPCPCSTRTPSSRCPAWSTPTAPTPSPSPRCPTTPPAWSARSRPSSARSWPPPSPARAPAAVKAFALHPLVDSVNVARRLVDGYTGGPPRPRVP